MWFRPAPSAPKLLPIAGVIGETDKLKSIFPSIARGPSAANGVVRPVDMHDFATLNSIQKPIGESLGSAATKEL
jgi:hypothetical protein